MDCGSHLLQQHHKFSNSLGCVILLPYLPFLFPTHSQPEFYTMAQQRKSMKIIIVGSGIAGLSTYLFLQKYCAPLIDLEITIYESYRPGSKRSLAEATFQELSSSSQIAGGGLGLSPNGMRILRELDGDLHDRVEKAGFVTEKFVFKSARGWRLNVSPASDMRGKRGNPPGEEVSSPA